MRRGAPKRMKIRFRRREDGAAILASSTWWTQRAQQLDLAWLPQSVTLETETRRFLPWEHPARRDAPRSRKSLPTSQRRIFGLVVQICVPTWFRSGTSATMLAPQSCILTLRAEPRAFHKAQISETEEWDGKFLSQLLRVHSKRVIFLPQLPRDKPGRC